MSEQSALSTGPFDVIIVGLGPVGQSLALLLAQQGHSIAVVERQKLPYPLPRAVRYTSDVSRLLDSLGVADSMADFASPSETYEWQNAERKTLLKFFFPAKGQQGWPEATMFTQHILEERLRQRGKDFPNLAVYRGYEATELTQDSSQATLTVKTPEGETVALAAKYVVGCDGARSFVREQMNTTVTDLGFSSQWLVCDFTTNAPREWHPDNLQVCDPERPTTVVNSGPGRRRFEFMMMPSDNVADFDTDENAWALMSAWDVTPENSQLERRAMYTFQARWADTWRDGRIFLAGDAAHQMPPFYGVGMVSGMRDSMNLAWKLDLVLNGQASDQLLDTYESERFAHVQHAIGISVELGKVICETIPEAVAGRDAHFLTNGPDPQNALPPLPPERLGPGAFASMDGNTGTMANHGLVGFASGQTDLLDHVTTGKFFVIANGAEISAEEADQIIGAIPAGIDALVVRVLPEGSAVHATTTNVIEVSDVDGVYLPYLAAHGNVAELIRPDFYIFGEAKTSSEAVTMVSTLSKTAFISA